MAPPPFHPCLLLLISSSIALSPLALAFLPPAPAPSISGGGGSGPTTPPPANFEWPLESLFLTPPLRFGFYKDSCPRLEAIVEAAVRFHSGNLATVPAQLLRLFFHDCFVQGADASVLLDPSNTTQTERKASNNFSLSSFYVIDDIKQQVELACPGMVSCADILALTAVYAIAQAGGPLYPIELGRRDTLTSFAQSALGYLPGFTLNVSGLIQNFQFVGLDVVDMVALSGGHTIGQGHCSSLKDRLYPVVDPSFNAGQGEMLLKFCTDQGRLRAPDFLPNVQFFIDPITPLTFDNQYFKNLVGNQALFTSDKVLYNDPRTVELVNLYANDQYAFFEQFGKSLRKMGKINVLTGSQGQIRKQCWIQNSGNQDPALDAGTFV